MSLRAEIAGRFAREALESGGGDGEVCATFRRSFYLCCPGERYVCIGDASLGPGPLNALIRDLRIPSIGLDEPFELDDYSQHRLVEGLDDIGITERSAGVITAFEAGRPAYLPSTT